MKIVQVLYSGLGGHGSVATSIIQGDRDKKVTHQLLFYGIEPVKEEYLCFCKNQGIEHRSIQKKEGKNLKYWRLFYQTLKELQPDVILLHSTNLVIPASFFVHQHKSCLFINIEHQPNQIKRRSEWFWTKFSLKQKLNNVYLTPSYLEELKAKYGKLISTERSFVIPNGIDTNKFKRGIRSLEDRFIISMQARFSRTKKQIELIQAFEKADLPMHVELHFAGDGELFNETLHYVAQSPKKDAIKMHGMLDENNLIELLTNTDLYIHASKGETMSTAVMQAMSMELPVIGSNIPGINNLFEPGKSGATYDTTEELIQLMQSLYEDAEKRLIFGKNAREYALKNFNHTILFERYYSLIQDLKK